MLAGSSGKRARLTLAVRIIARIERLRLGPRGRSALVHSLALGIFNKPFAPVRTEADWLSRDSAEVDKYLADPLCRFRPALQLWIDLLDALGEIAKPARQARIPKQLPIAKLTRAPANNAPIGGLKVVASSGWFAVRPSGMENIYKIYAESFRDQSHLNAVVSEAQEIVNNALNSSNPHRGLAEGRQ